MDDGCARRRGGRGPPYPPAAWRGPMGGLAFYLVMTTLWGRPPAGGRNYVVQFLAWAFAWAPGLVALTGDRQRESPLP